MAKGTVLLLYYIREDLVLYALFNPLNEFNVREDLVQLALNVSYDKIGIN